MNQLRVGKVPTTSARDHSVRRKSAGPRPNGHPIAKLQTAIGNQAVQRLINFHYVQAKLQVSSPGDRFEREADQVADTVMRMPDPQPNLGVPVSNRTRISRIDRKCMECEKETQRQPLNPEEETVQTKSIGPTPVVQRACAGCSGPSEDDRQLQKKALDEDEPLQKQAADEEPEDMLQGNADGQLAASHEVQSQIDALRGGGQRLPESARNYFEPRFGQDFGGVRLHTGAKGARAARSINARAFTTGRDIAFGTGQYSPESNAGKRLLAHELTHVVQQGGASHIDSGAQHSPGGLMRHSSSASEHCGQMVQRAPIEILPADFIGAPGTGQRRAAASCDIDCDGTSLGTLHAMPISFHASRGAPLASSAGANGIGAALHFIRVTTVLQESNSCSPCTNFKIIQVINSNEPADSRGESFVDNAASGTPFYGDVYASGTGVHPIPAGIGIPDEGSDVQTTHSIYDTPYRPAGRLGIVTGKNFFWNAEACVTCIKPGKDKVLGCATYGFKRDWDAGTRSHGPVQSVGPGCLKKPSAHFVSTLTSDSSTSSYKFET